MQLFLLFILSIMNVTQSNNTNQHAILGKWKMIKMDIPGGIYFDVSDHDSSYTRFKEVNISSRRELLGKDKPLREEDSAQIKIAFEQAFEEFRQLFVEFKMDNKYIANQSGEAGKLILVTGSFSLDTVRHRITMAEAGQPAKEYHYVLSGPRLFLQSVELGNPLAFIILEKED